MATDAVTSAAVSLAASIASLCAVPRAPFEPVDLRIVEGSGSLGRLMCPPAWPVSSLSPRAVASSVSLRGQSTIFIVDCVADESTSLLSQDELEVSLSALARHVVVRASTRSSGSPKGDPTSFTIEITSLASFMGLAAKVSFGEGQSRNLQLVLEEVTVAGQALPALSGAHFAVLEGMLAPLTLYPPENPRQGAIADEATPAISSSGALYVPIGDHGAVMVFGPDGSRLPSIGEPGTRSICVCDRDERGILLLASRGGGVDVFDAATATVRQKIPRGDCFGLAALVDHGVVAVSAHSEGGFKVLRASDGVILHTVQVPGGSFYCAADPLSATFYIGKGPSPCSVSACQWQPAKGGDTGVILPLGIVTGAGSTGNCRPMAVVPPAPGLRTAYLLVGTIWSSELRVVSLPDHALVHTHVLQGMSVTGLAADPTGTAIAVCDKTLGAVHVLPWPLPGMPALT